MLILACLFERVYLKNLLISKKTRRLKPLATRSHKLSPTQTDGKTTAVSYSFKPRMVETSLIVYKYVWLNCIKVKQEHF
ncbi:hypothetical protein [Microcoleus sp. D2_18a_D3]|uniref:hypothetical protein n=1 Tax=Microcoleus sp. D2_18a_D3 TaxID=3055330 RepID=UPI002FD4FD26